jgi:SpoIID/LytB domain protein
MRRTSLLAVCGLLGALVGALPASAGAPVHTAASAEEVYARPADGVFHVEGHGWGHGRGLSQWGAQGAASLGRSADEITATYYPGTARTVLPDAPVRVWLSSDEGRDTVVWAADGLRVTDAATGSSTLLPAGPTRWRATVDAAGLHLSSLTGATWTPYALGGATASAGPLRFSGPTLVRVGFPGGSSRDYRGAITAVRTGTASLRTVDVLGLEDYLLGVVPRESSSGWLPAALQAQAIAARSYSASTRARVGAGASYDICDSTACQVFGGTRLYTSGGTATWLEPQSTTDAVHATTGVVRSVGGAPVFAEFSSSNGGWSTSGSASYLQAHADPWDGAVANPVHSWTALLPVSALEHRYPQIGTLLRVRIVTRDGNGDWGGRVQQVLVEGTAGTANATGGGLYLASSWPASSTGLRSNWFHVVGATAGSTGTTGSGSTGGAGSASSTASSVVRQSTAPVLVRPPGVPTGALTVTLRNTGTTPWPAAGLHLAVADPAGGPDRLVGGSTRPGRYLGTADVAPGATADFSVALDASGLPAGGYDRRYRVRLGAGALVGAVVSWHVVVAPAQYTAARASTVTSVRPAAATVLADGRTVVVPRSGSTTVRLAVRNTGNLVWPGNGTVQLATSGPRDRVSASAGSAWLSSHRPARSVGAATPPGATATFDVTLAGADRPVGVSFEQFEPVWTGRHWLDGAVLRLAAVRVDPSVPRLAVLHSAPLSVTVAKGHAGVLVLRLRNVGGSAWTVGRERVSAWTKAPVRTAAWTAAARPPALVGNATRPGATAVAPGEIGEWRVPLAGRAAGTWPVVLQAVDAHGAGYGPRVTTTVTVR